MWACMHVCTCVCASLPSPSSHVCSKVHLVRQIEDDSLLVVKQIPIQEMPKEERQAALNEVDVLKMLKHPNIVAYEGSFLHNQSLMIVMEYAPGMCCRRDTG